MSEEKKEILLSSFNTLKTDLLKNSRSISNIILKLMKEDLNLSFEIWKYVINNVDLTRDYNSSLAYTRNLSYEFLSFNTNDLLNQILNDEKLLRKLYRDNIAPDFDIVAYLFNNKKLFELNNILTLIYSNPYQEEYEEDPFGEYLEHVVEVYFKKWDKDTVDFIIDWTKKLKTEESKSRIKVLLIDYL